MNTSLLLALGVGAGTAVVLFAVHYALDHYAPAFRAHPPRAYSVGVGILFAGYSVWGALVGQLPTVAALGLLTAAAGLGTWGAYWWHNRQKAIRGARVTKGLGDGTGTPREF